ncbi:MAG: transcriptional regulator FilR1 domain-containing protein [Halobacteriota archaeon]|nr:transcriptional regulator FilR1 domain-containing protein [Halobacteriota archaeon]
MLSNESQEDAINIIKFIIGSDTRIKVLLSLEEEAQDLSCLRDKTDLNSSTLLHAINKLEDNDLVIKGKKGYSLTQIGKIHLMNLVDLIKTLGTLNLYKEFWLNHYIEDIPETFLREMGDLVESDLVKSTKIDILKPMSVLEKIISEAKKVDCIVPIFQHGFLELIEGLLNKGADVKLILTEELFEMIAKEHNEILRKAISKENFEIWVTSEDIKLAFVVTDSTFLLGLFRKDGSYDISENLVSHSDDAISWGERLFKYYQRKLKYLSINDIK